MVFGETNNFFAGYAGYVLAGKPGLRKFKLGGLSIREVVKSRQKAVLRVKNAKLDVGAFEGRSLVGSSGGRHPSPAGHQEDDAAD